MLHFVGCDSLDKCNRHHGVIISVDCPFSYFVKLTISDETLIREHFHWGPVTDHSIHLTWDVPPPDETMDAVIKVKAVVGSDPLTERSASAPFSKGELTLDGLKSDSLYTVTVMGIVDGHKYFEFNENIHTKESGKLHLTVAISNDTIYPYFLEEASFGFIIGHLILATFTKQFMLKR